MGDDLGTPDQVRLNELCNLCCALGAADAPTLVELRRFLLDAMFPSMPDSIRTIVLPLFALATLEHQAVEHGLRRLGEVGEQS